ncbi:response regulator [Oscillatoria sp. FACHB-1406]|uniref:response regulator n=1 Tax=Oscillatoria sp. FACHB-1406 TaxID=2692846 RepID=UPI0016889D80|nr:response regulator [Oscillatoria sp. FACHB-1406]MBD2576100.1 response regulator [Oscillatoria sp. FACHB-1406]
MRRFPPRPIEILLVEDSISDAKLMAKALRQCKIATQIHRVRDGVEALDFLRQEGQYADCPLPHLILLDLNLPRKNGWEVLTEIKSDPRLRAIPAIVSSSSDDSRDILRAYQLHANSYVAKPTNLEQFRDLVRSLEDFWLTLAKLPSLY